LYLTTPLDTGRGKSGSPSSGAAGGLQARPIDRTTFAATMAPFEPFEQMPRVAVAVSGGADSLALALLARDWAADRGGDVIAFIVDHGLRSESAVEAVGVRDRLAAAGIFGEVLTRTGPPPDAAIEAVARADRYELLEAACRRHGLLHLLLAHHRDDQAETVLIRLAAGSGVSGLAGMASETSRPDVRLLRPLLGMPADRLAATVASAGLPPIRDPMNQDPRHARVRLRQSRTVLAREGLTPVRLARLAEDAAAARRLRETATGDLAGKCVHCDPLGFLRVDVDRLLEADREVAAGLLLAGVRAVSGDPFGPRRARLESAFAGLVAGWRAGQFRGRTLGGCLLRRLAGRAGRPVLLISREPAAMAPAVPLTFGSIWDRRFRWLGPARDGWTLGALGPVGWAHAVAQDPALARRVPGPVRVTLPALIPPDGGAVPVPAWRNPRDSGVVWTPARPLAAGRS